MPSGCNSDFGIVIGGAFKATEAEVAHANFEVYRFFDDFTVLISHLNTDGSRAAVCAGADSERYRAFCIGQAITTGWI